MSTNFFNASNYTNSSTNFNKELIKYFNESHLTKSDFAKLISMDRSNLTKRFLRDDVETIPNKEILFKMVIALRLNEEESNHLLYEAGYSLNPRFPLDNVWAKCLENNNYDRKDIDNILLSKGLSKLFVNYDIDENDGYYEIEYNY